MVTPSQPRVVKPRLNPFVFPADTDFRFVLLIVAVLGASMFIYNWFYHSVPANREQFLDITIKCRSTAGFVFPLDPLAQNAVFNMCRASVERASAAWMITGMCLLLAVAGAIYRVLPNWKIRRGRFVPLERSDVPEIVTYLAELCREAGLSCYPTFVWNPLNPAVSGLAFGRFRRQYVLLTGGLVTRFYTDRPAFRAVVFHELAHLRNADVNKTYFTIAVWRAFIFTSLIPFIISLFDQPADIILHFGWRVLALTALVYLTRNAVLRAREVYADVRASTWDGPQGALDRVLATLQDAKLTGRRYVWQVHPDPRDRRKALHDTRSLCDMGFWTALGTGIATTIAFPNVLTLLNALMAGSSQITLTPTIAALILMSPAISVIGLGVWRATFAALAQTESPYGTYRLGLGLGVGIILGQMLTFSFIGEPEPGLIFDVIWSIVLVMSLALFVQWIAAGASVWLEVAVTHTVLRFACITSLVIAGGILALWIGMLFLLRAMSNLIPFLALDFLTFLGAIWLVMQNPLTLMMFVSLWSYPLGSLFLRGWVASYVRPNWIFLETPSRPLALRQQITFRFALPLLAGLVSGLIFCGLLLIIRIGLLLVIPEAVRNTGEYRLTFFLGQVALAVLLQVGVAAFVTSSINRLA